MPNDLVLMKWWLGAVTAAFFLKGTVFAALAWTIWHEHRQVGSKPTQIGRELINMFLSITGTSFFLAFIFGLSLWSIIHGEFPPPPHWVRWVFRILLLLSPALVVFFGSAAYRSVRDEAARRANGTDSHRQMLAMERIANQGDVLAEQGVADRSATATERIADSTDSISRQAGL